MQGIIDCMRHRGGSRIFLEGGMNIEVISEAGGHSPPEAIGCYII